MRATRLLCFGLLGALGCHGAASPTPGTTILPLRTLRLYETGVGYFERSGGLSASQGTSLPVPAGHLDDALKTLVVLTPGGKSQVNGVEFGSSMGKGMARALAGLPLDAEAPITYGDILTSLKGAHVELTTRLGAHRGRIVDVVHDEGKAEPAERTVLLITDAGEIRRARTDEVLSVRPTDPSFASRFGSALDGLSRGARGAEAPRMLKLLGTGDRASPITLGYVAEAPIWRTTYRLVLDADGKSGTLQGWALLHNDTDEDWRGVHVDLVNGRPDSFLFPLAAPRYARRELVRPQNEASTVPQLLGTTVDAIWGDHIGDSFGASGLGVSGVGEGGGGRGEGIGLGSIGGMGHGRGSGAAEPTVSGSSLLDVGNLAAVREASGVESGALFTYALPGALDLRAHGSALVPFVQRGVEAEAVTWVGDGGAPPRSAVRLVNSTSQTIPAGPIAFFGDGGFAGESALDRLKPNERRFVEFGADLDVLVASRVAPATEVTKKIRFERDHLEEHFLRTSTLTYDLENRSGRPRRVFVVLALAANAKVTGADELDFDTSSSKPVAVFRIAPREKITRTAAAVEGLSRSTPVAALTSARLTELSQDAGLATTERALAGEAAAKLGDLEATRKAAEGTKAEATQLGKDLERLREHLKALGDKASPGGANPFVTRILAGEDRLVALRKKLEALDVETQTRTAAVLRALGR